MANMSKSDVLSDVAGSAGCTKADAEAVIEAFFGCVESAAKAGKKTANEKTPVPGPIINRAPAKPKTTPSQRRGPTLSFRMNTDSIVTSIGDI